MILEEFYTAGFFGVGSEGDFKLFSFAYFAPIILMIAIIILIYKFRNKLRDYKHEERIRFIAGFIMIMDELGYMWRLMYVGSGADHDPNMLAYIPLQVCTWTNIFAAFMIMKKDNNLFNAVAYVALTLGIFPLLTPTVISTTGPRYFRYYQYYIAHTMPIICVFYMLFVHKAKIEIKKVWLPIAWLEILVILSIIANKYIPQGNFLFLGGTDGKTMMDIFPKSLPIRVLILHIGVYSIFAALYGIYRLIMQIVNKKQIINEQKGLTE